ncbi:MAG: serine/threonine-protein kinase [Victivallales bacterium]
MIKSKFQETICPSSDTENVGFNIDMWQSGIVICPKCTMPIESREKILGVHPCPNCQFPVFFPCKMKDYVLYSTLGTGGLGRVFLAMKVSEPGRKYAVKVSNHAFTGDEYSLRILLREANTGLDIGRHPNIVEILDVDMVGNLVFVVLPLVEGMRLDRLISHSGFLSERKSLHLVSQIIEAEIHISSKGFLYRDLKPENIIVDKVGNARLFDYGLTIKKEAAGMAGKLEYSDDIEGSPYYIPPERILGLPENESSEIYSMGMMLYHMLKGQPYFSTVPEIEQIVRSHVLELKGISVADEMKRCTTGTIRLVDRMITRMPSMRYQTFDELRIDVRDILSEVATTKTIKLKKSDLFKDGNSPGTT